MVQIDSNEYWNDVLEKFSKHKGSIKDFCKQNNVNAHTLYAQRKKLERKNNTTPVFHAVDVQLNKATEDTTQITKEPNSSPSEIRIEIGKAKIYIDSNNHNGLSLVVKELAANC